MKKSRTGLGDVFANVQYFKPNVRATYVVVLDIIAIHLKSSVDFCAAEDRVTLDSSNA